MDNADGCNSEEEIEEACATLSINEKAIVFDMDLYPNTASNLVTLRYYCNERSCMSIALCSIEGLEIIQLFLDDSNKGNNQLGIDCSNLPVGVYLIKLQTSKEIITKKLVIQ